MMPLRVASGACVMKWFRLNGRGFGHLEHAVAEAEFH
jgi:hypothetical protein